LALKIQNTIYRRDYERFQTSYRLMRLHSRLITSYLFRLFCFQSVSVARRVNQATRCGVPHLSDGLLKLCSIIVWKLVVAITWMTLRRLYSHYVPFWHRRMFRSECRAYHDFGWMVHLLSYQTTPQLVGSFTIYGSQSLLIRGNCSPALQLAIRFDARLDLEVSKLFDQGGP
jgi:hypothetical protein